MQKFDLSGQWALRKRDSYDSMHVNIPGTVLSGYIENNRMDNPYYRLNEKKAYEMFDEDYEFERTFMLPANMVKEKKQLLVCEGLDTNCEVFINGMIVGRSDNMHRTWIFDVNNFVKEGENVIKVLCKSPNKACEVKPRADYDARYAPTGCKSGNQFIRKAHSDFGWDWGPCIPDAGIIRDISLLFYSDCRITDVYYTQKHEDKIVHLEAEVFVDNATDSERQAVIRAKAPNGKIVTESATIEFGAPSIVLSVDIDDPKLWWPNGMGEQNLYEITITVGGDEKYYRVGLREFEVCTEEDKWGREFCFKINGKKFFAKGANYIPEDAIYPHITVERMDSLINAAIDANFNTIRVWGGGYYPSDEFYDLCDQYGLIVWQDLMFACNIYDITDAFKANVKEEIKDNVRRLRHHAALGMWCGNNEIEEAFAKPWDGFDDIAEVNKENYLELFETTIKELMEELDPQRLYWPSSPSGNGGFDKTLDENTGDSHYWDVWHGMKPFDDYKNHYFRFLSEFGFQSFPSIKTIAAFTEADDRNIFTEVMESHQKNPAANGKILCYLADNFLYPKDFPSLIYVSQVMQALAIKTGVEHLRRNRGRCMGTLYWQLNDNWPVASWSSVDYYGRYKALHYFAKKFYAPVLASLERKEYKITPVVTNDTMEYARFKITLTVKDFNFRPLYSETVENRVDAMSVYREKTIDVEEYVKGKEKDVFLEMVYTDADGKKHVDVEVFAAYKHLHLIDPELTGSMRETEDSFVYSIGASGFAPFVEVSLPEADGKFSDNFFHITSNEPVSVEIKKSDFYGQSAGVNVISLFDSYYTE